MKSNFKYWFLSEASETTPGTDKDIDYYTSRVEDLFLLATDGSSARMPCTLSPW